MPRCGGLFTDTENSSEDLVCFKNHSIIKDLWIQICHYLLLWKTSVLGTLTMCVKSSGMGSSPNCFQYPWACGSTMCVEPKLKLLVVVRFTCCCNSFQCQFDKICWGHTLEWNPRFWWGAPYLSKEHAKTSGVCFKPFPFMDDFCLTNKSS